MQAYDHKPIEARWQAFWKDQETFRCPNPGEPGFDPDKPKYYVLDMFPYPSGAGLHVGHPIGYIGTDIVSRRKRMEGFNVLHPMGYDAFGLPAEQYAIQTGKHPAETTEENTANFRAQMQRLGLSFDWAREFATSDIKYYKWTQWIFTRLYDRGLAYQTEVAVWWCEALRTVLANEEVINGRSERGDHPCVRRPLKQWMLKITAYADRLIEDLDGLDWPESVKTMQREWIGRSEGAEVRFPIVGDNSQGLSIFTTRPDTLFGATFMVVAPEHPLLNTLVQHEHQADVEAYIKAASLKTDLERTDLAKTKSGVFTGGYCLNPAFEEDDPRAKLPVYVADYVLISYGTGAIMAVPGQDQRDWEFAKAYDLSIVRTVQPPEGFDGEAFTGDGPAIQSAFLDGMGVVEAKARMIEWLAEKGLGEARTTYRLRDWLFSRQRYWGEPFPVLHKPDGTHERVRDEDLPVELPQMDDFAPSEDGEPPLSKATKWVQTQDPTTGEPRKRDTDTMPGWAGSCWYYLRFMDPHNGGAPFSKEAVEYWNQVDLYVGGAEHAVLHLLYARFWHKVLFDEGLVPTKEPFQRMFNQGMLQSFAYKDKSGRLTPVDEVDAEQEPPVMKTTGEPVERITAKISKSLKNVVNPDDVCDQYGVDSFRLYEMFMGPLADSKPWNDRDVPGVRRFLERVWRLFVNEDSSESLHGHLTGDRNGEPTGDTLALERVFHKSLQRVNDSFQHFNFNTAIAAFMEFVNAATKQPKALDRDLAGRFVCALAPFAPHMSEELWSRLGHEPSVCYANWPSVNEAYLVEDEFELVVQVMGKVRGRTPAPMGASKEALTELAKSVVTEQLAGKKILKTIVVPGKLVNFVAK